MACRLQMEEMYLLATAAMERVGGCVELGLEEGHGRRRGGRSCLRRQAGVAWAGVVVRGACRVACERACVLWHAIGPLAPPSPDPRRMFPRTLPRAPWMH